MPIVAAGVVQDLIAGLPASMQGKDKVRYVLPFLLLARITAKLEPSRADVLAAIKSGAIAPADIQADLPAARMRAQKLTKLPYFTTSEYGSPEAIDATGHKARLEAIVNGLSKEVSRSLTAMGILDHIREVAAADGLLGFIRKVVTVQADLATLTDDEFGSLLLAILQSLTEATADNAADCATASDLANLAARILVAGVPAEGSALRTVYDPACGTGGLLFTAGQEVVARLGGTVKLRGHEIRKEMAALAHLYGLLRMGDIYTGQPAAIRVQDPPTLTERANSLTADGLRFPAVVDFAVWNPPMGKAGKWGDLYGTDVAAERVAQPGGRYAAGVPGKDDSSLLFVMHALSKLKPGGRAVAFMNASPLFEGEVAETKNSQQVRLWLMNEDWLDAVIALPSNVHFNTDIVTYLWVFQKDRPSARKGKVVLINAARETESGPAYAKLIKPNLNKKRYSVAAFVDAIVALYDGALDATHPDVRVLDRTEFMFKEVKVDRALKRRFQVTPDRVSAFLADADVVKALAAGGPPGKAARKLRERLAVVPEGVLGAGDLIDPDTAEAWKAASNKVLTAFVVTLGLDEDSDEVAADTGGYSIPDPTLTDVERVPWKEEVESYLEREVEPYVGLAWPTADPRPGCEINFNRFFYEYKAPRSLEEIAAALAAAREEEAALLAETRSVPATVPPRPAIQTSLRLFPSIPSGPRVFDAAQDAGEWPIPVLSIKAAAGAFSEGQHAEVEGWIGIEGERRDRGRFLLQVRGESMNREVPNGAWCLWEHFGAYGVAGAREGDRVLVRREDEDDPENGAFTFKRVKKRGGRISLCPESSDPTFQPLELVPGDRFIARLVTSFEWEPRWR